MELAAALAAIQNCDTLPNRAEIHGAIAAEIGRVKGLEDERDRISQSKAEILNEKKQLQVKSEKLQKLLDETIADVEGETPEEKSGKLKTLSGELAALKQAKLDAEAKAEAAEQKATGLEQGLLYQRIAAKVGADPEALTKLLNLPSDRLVIEDAGVMVWDEARSNKVALKEHVQTLGEWQQRAIFPEVPTPPGNPPKPNAPAPSAPPSGTPKKEVNANSILGSMYSFPKKAG